VLAGYALAGLVIMLCFFGVSRAVEVRAVPSKRSFFGLHKSRAVVLKLSALFSLDAFAGGLVVQSLVAYWLSMASGTPASSAVFSLAPTCWPVYRHCLRSVSPRASG
jgi:hypothetical protein